MKGINFFVIICSLLFTFSTKAQDFNWGFEDWEIVNDIETPTGWAVNHFVSSIDSFYVNRFYKDSINVVEGNYSLLAVKDDQINSAFLDCTSRADRYQLLDEEIGTGKSVYFSIKSESLNEWDEALAKVTVGFSTGSDYLGRVEWASYEEIEEFVEIELPIEFENAKAVSIIIEAASQNGGLDECNLESLVWVDAFRIDESSSVQVVDYDFKIVVASPNPSRGIVTLSTTELNGSDYRITDAIGKVIQVGTVQNNQIALDNIGINLISISTNDGSLVRLKCIKSE